MEYKNILFPLHTFKDNRMSTFKSEQKVVTVLITEINKTILENDGWQVQSLTIFDEVRVIILFQRIVY